MMEGGVSDAEKRNAFTNIVFSWSLEDIFNENLYLNQVLDLHFSFNYVHSSIGFRCFGQMQYDRCVSI